MLSGEIHCEIREDSRHGILFHITYRNFQSSSIFIFGAMLHLGGDFGLTFIFYFFWQNILENWYLYLAYALFDRLMFCEIGTCIRVVREMCDN